MVLIALKNGSRSFMRGIAVIFSIAILFGGTGAASADQLTLVCRSTVMRTLADGSTGYTDPYKVFVDMGSRMEHTDYQAPFSVAIDDQAIAGRFQISSDVAGYSHIDRTTGDYEYRQCLSGACGQPPSSWTMTDKGHCEKGQQRF
jgi:hypothetical protein